MKKKVLLILVLLLCVMYVPSVFAANIHSCSNSLGNVMIDEKIPNTVSTIITVIKIAVPVLLVIFGMLDLMKGITAQKDDEIKKGQQLFIKRLISGALVFFVFTIVQMIISFVANEDKTNMMTCVQCFINGECTYEKKSNGKCPTGTEKSDDDNYCIEK